MAWSVALPRGFVAARFGRELVRGQAGRHEADRRGGVGVADGAELLQLALPSPARTRSWPRRWWCRSAPSCAARARTFVVSCSSRGLARGAHGGGDPAAGRRDLLVGLALQPAVELRLAQAGERDVRVRVDEARDGRGPARVEVVVDGQPAGRSLSRPDEGEASVADHDDRVLVTRPARAWHAPRNAVRPLRRRDLRRGCG